jgi:hypothetical protein
MVVCRAASSLLEVLLMAEKAILLIHNGSLVISIARFDDFDPSSACQKHMHIT